ncbi:MAG: hypothetical protein GY746_18720 [Gammaproteobacteria bacterium]|nr:hypothetical protein [Gammaproteobacteria bacterium]
MDLIDFIKESICRSADQYHIDPAMAEKIAADLDVNIRKEYGCERCYIPTKSKEVRNKEIISDWRSGKSRKK